MSFYLLSTALDYVQILYGLAQCSRLLENTVRIRQRGRVRPVQSEPVKNFIQDPMRQLPNEDAESFFNITRLSTDQFERLLRLVGPSLQTSNIREPIAPQTRLLITLSHLATGDSYRSLHLLFGIGQSVISNIIYETCDALKEKLQPICLPELTKQKLKGVAQGFEQISQFPHIAGSIGVKYTVINMPVNTSSLHFDYKKNYSYVLLAISDGDYKFTYFQMIKPSDFNFRRNSITTALYTGKISLPDPCPVLNGSKNIPFMFVADFNMDMSIMRPIMGRKHLTPAQQRYNIEIGKAKSVIENSFGILAARWNLFLRRMTIVPGNAEKIITAAVLLHNYVLSSPGRNRYLPRRYADQYNGDRKVPGSWRHDAESSVFVELPKSYRIGHIPSLDAVSLQEEIGQLLLKLHED